VKTLLNILLLCAALCETGGPPAKVNTFGETTAALPAQRKLAYHKNPPAEPQPATLDPAQFANDRGAFVAYRVAADERELLYQIPCYCPCDRKYGHKSLLDCFTTKHGSRCLECQKEAMFCYLQRKKGKNPQQIRKGIADGKAWDLDLTRYADRLDSEHRPIDR
jgi:hypothetical protein